MFNTASDISRLTMKTFLPPLHLLSLLAALPLLLGACADEQPLFLTPSADNEGSGVYVSIVVNTEAQASTRMPTPGESGDGPQPGVGDENEVHDLNVFFFQGEVTAAGERLGINSQGDIPIVAHHYFPNLTPSASGSITRYWTPSVEIQGLLIGETYDVLVVANAGDKFEMATSHQTLSALRDETHLAMSEEPDGHHFLMASAGPEVNSIEIIPNNSPTNPSVVSVNVERLAARVDYHIAEEYSVEDTEDKVKIVGATLVNKYKGSSYLFKRVTEGTSDLTATSSVIYLADEKGSSTEPASNYVVDPKTLNPPTSDIGSYYDIYFPTVADWTSITWQQPDEKITSEYKSVTYGLLDYTQENVVLAADATSSMSQYCTGVVFKAQYTPANIDAETTFYWYAGKAYKTLTEIQPVMGGNITLNEDNYSIYGIRRYENGICYYTYWIRHADDANPDVISPMEYAIVRNNLYQLDIQSVSDIGSVTPQDEVKVSIVVYVKNWEPLETQDVIWGEPVSAY